MTHFMSKVATEEILALGKEIEGKLFNISFVDNEKKDTIKGIFSEILRNSVLEECFKDH